MDALRAYLDIRGLKVEILENEPETLLIAKLRLEEPLTPARIYEVLVTAFEQRAANIAVRDRRPAGRIRQASTHWLRHTYGSLSAARRVPQDVLQANLGHERLATTSIYIRDEKGRRHKAMQAAFALSTGNA